MDLLRRWRRLWRVEPVDIYSPLSMAEAADRLVSGVTTRRQVPFGGPVDADARLVWGSVDGRKIRLWSSVGAARGMNGWSPLLKAELVPAGTGCRLLGTLGWRRLVRGFTCLWLGCATVIVIGGLVVFGAHAAAGSISGGDVLVVLGPAGALCFFVRMVAVSGREGRRDAAFLQEWLRDTLRAS